MGCSTYQYTHHTFQRSKWKAQDTSWTTKVRADISCCKQGSAAGPRAMRGRSYINYIREHLESMTPRHTTLPPWSKPNFTHLDSETKPFKDVTLADDTHIRVRIMLRVTKFTGDPFRWLMRKSQTHCTLPLISKVISKPNN